jgi:hypothetical protein
LTQTQDVMHIRPDPSADWLPSKTISIGPFMTLTKEAITRSAFDRLDLSKGGSAKAVEAPSGSSRGPLRVARMYSLVALGSSA